MTNGRSASTRVFSEYFGTAVRAFAVTTGTAANSLSLATLSARPTGRSSRTRKPTSRSTSAARPGFFSGGAQLDAAARGARAGRRRDRCARRSTPIRADVHSVQPAALSLTQATELGTAYRPAELAALCELAHERGLKVHMDGARFANAVAFLDCHPGDITWRAGVDVLSFGATKNGALAAEAVVFFDPRAGARLRAAPQARRPPAVQVALRRGAAARLRRDGRLAAQRRAHQPPGAATSARAAGSALLHPVEANEVFVRLGVERRQRAARGGLRVLRLGPGERRARRASSSPGTSREEDVQALCAALRRLALELPQARRHRQARGADRRQQPADHADDDAR